MKIRASRHITNRSRAVAGVYIWPLVGSAVGIGACAYLSSIFFEPRGSTLIIGSFGASAVLLYAACDSPLAQPRNLIGGHIVSALAGVAMFQLIGNMLWLAAALGVSLAIMAMMLTHTLHPPGGATALIAVIGGEGITRLGFYYVLIPVGLGAFILLLVALVTNRLAGKRYPA